MGLRRGYNIRESLTHVVQGLLMGAADIIPGVSGGTIAFIVGIYPRLIAAISHGFSMLTSLAKGRLGEMRRHGASLEWGLVIPLAAGIGAALLVGAKVIPTLLETWPHQTLGLFLGLVAGSRRGAVETDRAQEYVGAVYGRGSLRRGVPSHRHSCVRRYFGAFRHPCVRLRSHGYLRNDPARRFRSIPSQGNGHV